MTTTTGTIEAVHQDPMSGIARVEVDGLVVLVDSGFGIRQLCAAADGDPVGLTIEYEVDDLGIMLAFEVV